MFNSKAWFYCFSVCFFSCFTICSGNSAVTFDATICPIWNCVLGCVVGHCGSFLMPHPEILWSLRDEWQEINSSRSCHECVHCICLLLFSPGCVGIVVVQRGKTFWFAFWFALGLPMLLLFPLHPHSVFNSFRVNLGRRSQRQICFGLESTFIRAFGTGRCWNVGNRGKGSPNLVWFWSVSHLSFHGLGIYSKCCWKGDPFWFAFPQQAGQFLFVRGAEKLPTFLIPRDCGFVMCPCNSVWFGHFCVFQRPDAGKDFATKRPNYRCTFWPSCLFLKIQSQKPKASVSSLLWHLFVIVLLTFWFGRARCSFQTLLLNLFRPPWATHTPRVCDLWPVFCPSCWGLCSFVCSYWRTMSTISHFCVCVSRCRRHLDPLNCQTLLEACIRFVDGSRRVEGQGFFSVRRVGCLVRGGARGGGRTPASFVQNVFGRHEGYL